MNRSKETGFADRQSAAAAAKKAALERYQAVANDPGSAERQSARDAVHRARFIAADLDVGGGLRVGASADRVLVIVEDGQRDAAFAPQRIDKGGDRSVADPLDLPLLAIDLDGRSDAPLAGPRLGQD